MIRRLSLFAVVALLCGCSAFRETPTKVVVAPDGPKTKQRETAGTETNAKQSGLDEQRAARDSKVAASLDTISSVTENPATPREDVANRESKLAKQTLGATSTAEDQAASAERARLILQGEKNAADAAYRKADTESRKLLSDLAVKQHELDIAKAAETKAISDADAERKASAVKVQAAVDKLTSDYEKKLQDARDAESIKQARSLNIAGAAFLLVFGLAVGFGGLGGVKIGWPFGLLALLCFGLAQIVSQWWFLWACGGVTLVGVAVLGVWVYLHYRQGNLKAAAEDRADKLATLAHDIVPALDHAYESADGAVKELLDKVIFSPIGDKMDKGTKALVHSLRAEAKTAS